MNNLSLEKTGKEIKVPKVFFTNEDVIVMENLKLDNFRLVGDKEIGLSFNILSFYNFSTLPRRTS